MLFSPFHAAALSEFKDSLIKTEKENDILPVGVIYGPNGGGKSNLLAALGCVISLVTEPVYELGKNNDPSRIIILAVHSLIRPYSHIIPLLGRQAADLLRKHCSHLSPLPSYCRKRKTSNFKKFCVLIAFI